MMIQAAIESSSLQPGKSLAATLLALATLLFGATGSMYGAAGSLVALLVWVYYSSQIVFVGAELTRAWTLAREGGATERRRRVTNEVSVRASRANRKGIISPVLHGGPPPQPPGAGAGREFN